MAVVELASFARFTPVQRAFLEQLSESIGVVLNTIIANMRTEELLEQSQQLSHELRTPLNSLLILAKLLMENPDGNLTEKQIEFATTIHSAGSDLLDLINDILDLSKVEAGRMDLHVADVKLADVRDFVERSFRPVADDQGLSFEVEVHGANVPPTIETEEQRLQQVLKNLLSNAFKFTEKGSVKLRIEVAEGRQFASEALSRAETVVAFSVIDTGIGIPDDKLRLIFEAFQQADGTTSRR